jgi:hypothetical protein
MVGYKDLFGMMILVLDVIDLIFKVNTTNHTSLACLGLT